MTTSCIALLGRKDEPTDAVEEYCRYLGDALRAHDIQLEIRRVPWELHSWSHALRALQLQAAGWRDTWVLVQYTALAWSARGFPRKFLGALKILKTAGARIGLVFHDVEPYPGTRLVDRFRRSMQVRTMRRALSFADLAIFTVPPDKLTWQPVPGPNLAFIPVGANLPIPSDLPQRHNQTPVPTIGVFGITGGKAGTKETQDILRAVRHASEKLGKLRLSVFGRHAEIREAAIKEGLHDLPVGVSVEGVLEDRLVVERLRACDVLLFVRGGISTRRGSAIAAIACGVPIIAYVGPETAFPIMEAGVILVSPTIPQELDDALIRTLSDHEFRAGIALKNYISYNQEFSWSVIATRFASLLQRR